MGLLLNIAAMTVLATLPGTSGQSAAPPPQSEIIVHGLAPKRGATDYVDKILPSQFDVQLGRFEEPLCPETTGLADDLKSQVMSRIAAVAAAANVRMAGPRCAPNLFIIVIGDKKAMIEGLRQKKASYLYGLGGAAIKRLEDIPGPVAAWQVTDVVGADGVPLRVDGDGFPRLFTTLPPSRLTSLTRKRILAGVIVVEQPGLLNVSTRQLADYALVRALAPIETRQRVPPASSVLSLFNPGVRAEDAPQSVTRWDLAFLRALSDTRSDMNANAQRDEIRTKLLAQIARIGTTDH